MCFNVSVCNFISYNNVSSKQNCKLHLLLVTLFSSPYSHTPFNKLYFVSPHLTRAMMLVWLRGTETQTEGFFFFFSAALLSQSISHPTHLPERKKKHPNYTHWVHRHTHAQSLPPLLLLYVPFLRSMFPALTEAGSQREGKGFDLSSPWFWAFRSRGGLSSSSPNPQMARDKEQTYWSAFTDPFA